MKTIYAIYCVLITLAMLSAPASAEYNIAGDVNNDGMITTADSLLALRMAAGSVATDPERADVNADGRVNSLDTRMIRTMAEKTQVCVNAPEVVSGTFEVTIDIHNVADLDSGQFDLSFDPGVVNVTAVHDGDIDGRQVLIESWKFMDAGTIRVLFNLPEVSGVSGSGYVARIDFEVTGSQGDISVLDISDVGLVDTGADEIPAVRIDDEVTIGEHTPVNQVRNINTGEIYSSIKDAINDHDTSDGDVIEVGDGVYHENVKVTKSLTIRSENGPSNCVIQAARRYVVEVTVDHVSISGFTVMGLPESSFSRAGIYLTASYCSVSNNNCSNNEYGIYIYGSSNNIISDNTCSNNRDDGIYLCHSSNNRLTGNTCSNNGYGIRLDDSSDNKLTGNSMFGNGISIRGNSLSDYINEIDESNMVNGKPVYYWLDIESGRIPGGAGQVILVNCKCVLVEDQELNDVNVGVEAVFSSNVTIRNNTFSNNSIYGIRLDDSSNNSISSNNCLNNRAGIFLDGSSNNSISDNTCSNRRGDGIRLDDSSNNKVSGNDCSNNYWAGVRLFASSNNIISDNTCSNNERAGIYISGSRNNSISDNICSKNRDDAIHLRHSSNNRVSGNIMFENGISISGDSLSDYTHEIDESNMVNGKPVYYWKDLKSGRIPGGAGQVILVNCNDVLVEDQELNNANVGVEAVFSTNVTIRNNTFSNNSRYGILLDDSSNNIISDNTCSNNKRAGIYLGYSSNNSISDNTCSNNDVGILLGYSSNNILTGNSMFENGISIRGNSLSDYTHEIDESNMVNGKPVCYRLDIEYGRIPGGAGQVILVNCNDVLVEDQELNNANVGVEAVFSTNVTIRNNTCSNNDVGIYLSDSSNTRISDNTCSNNEWAGICLGYSSNNSISDNICSNNKRAGIYLDDSSNSKLTGNSMFGNGISISGNSLSDYAHEIDESNMVNGKPVCYRLDIEYGRIPEGAGQVILVNCNDVLVEDQELNNASIGIKVAFSSNIAIRTNNCSNNRDAGIHLYESRETAIYLNSFMNNADDIKISSCPSANAWNSTLKIDYTYKGTTFSNYLGNYWDDYEGSDLDGDGVGDTPYDTDSGKDNHPLMVPFKNRSAVTVDAPGIVSGAFNATINVHHIGDLDSGQFDLTFDSNIMNVTGVDAGTIDGTTVQVNWRFMDADTIRVLFELSDETGVSGSGYVARMGFAMMGPLGCVSVLDISNGKLVDTGGSGIPALWIDKEVIVAVPVTVNASPVVTDTFEVTIDVENVTDLDSGQFEFSFDPSVVTVEGIRAGRVGDTEIPTIWSFMDADTIMVLFNIPGVRGVSGSGCVARINFEPTGSPGDASVLDISNGLLVNNDAARIPAIWNDCKVTIGEYTLVNRVRNINTGEDFPFIRTAIDDPDTLDGHVIEVEDGVYHEHVRVTKSLTIRSLNGPANCVIRAAYPDEDVFRILSNDVCISGFTVKGATASAGDGIYIRASHCNISNNNVTNNHCGICLHSSDNTLTNNRMSGNRYNLDVCGGSQNIDTSNLVDGKPVYYWVNRKDQQIPEDAGFVGVVNSTNITVKDLTLTKNGAGVLFAYTNNSRIENVTVSKNDWGICLECSSNNTLKGNTMSMNSDNFRVSGDTLPHYTQNIDASNLVDGKPVYYWVGREDQQIPEDAGFVGIINSVNITVKDLTLTKNGAGVLFAYTNDSRIENVTVSKNGWSIWLYFSNNNMLINNKGRIWLYFSNNNMLIDNIGYISLDDSINNMLMNNTGSICLHDSSYNTLTGNTASDGKSFGILLWDSSNNVLSKNNVSNNWYGIWLFPSDGNTLANNIVSNNDVGIRMYTSDSNTLRNNTVSDNSCGIHLLSGSKNNRIYYNNFINNTDDIESSGTTNIWNSTEKTMYIYKETRYTNYLGNYWDDYNGTDTDNDGIGDTPHSIDSDRDNHPLMERSGNYLVSKPGHVPDNEAQVCVNAPEIVSGAFNVTIDVHNVVDLYSGEFNLSFDPGVVNVTAVRDGGIGGTPVPIEWWEFMDAGTIRVMFNLMALNGVNGSGQIVRISFEVTGSPGDSCVLDISDGRLVDTRADMIPAIWTRDKVAVRMSVPVMVRAPEVVSGTFDAAIDIENVIDLYSGEFNLSFDSSVVNVTAVHDGNVGGRRMSIEWWDFVDVGTIRVIFDLPGAAGVSGSGQIAAIGFEVTGSQYDTSVLDISDGHIFDTESNEIPALWDDSEVTVGVPVTVSAPEVVSSVSGAFNATIEIEDVRCMNGGQFDIRYDPDVLKVLNIEDGVIDGTEIPIVGVRRFEDDDHDRYRIFFKLDGVSGSGYVARINFELTGSQGDTSVLDISNGLLVDTGADKIPAVWINDTVTIGVPVTVNAPPVVSDIFDVTIDIENVTDLDSGQFELWFDSDVVTVEDVGAGSIGDTEIPVIWSFGDMDSIMVAFNLPGLRGVSGNGYVAKIGFAINGSQGGMSALDISNGLLVDTGADKIPAIWTRDEVTIQEQRRPDQ